MSNANQNTKSEENGSSITPSPTDLLSFYNLVGKLKATRRTGWVMRKIPNPESVSDHMYRMSMIALSHPTISSSEKIYLIKMCLAHDLAEAIVGDITPHDGVSKSEKADRERNAMIEIRDVLLKGSLEGHELYNLWNEYETGNTLAAKMCKDIDKLEMIIQADEYEQLHDTNLDEFFQSTVGKISTPLMQDIDQTLRNRRAHRLNDKDVKDAH